MSPSSFSFDTVYILNFLGVFTHAHAWMSGLINLRIKQSSASAPQPVGLRLKIRHNFLSLILFSFSFLIYVHVHVHNSLLLVCKSIHDTDLEITRLASFQAQPDPESQPGLTGTPAHDSATNTVSFHPKKG